MASQTCVNLRQDSNQSYSTSTLIWVYSKMDDTHQESDEIKSICNEYPWSSSQVNKKWYNKSNTRLTICLQLATLLYAWMSTGN